jgi:hypothetical protein
MALGRIRLTNLFCKQLALDPALGIRIMYNAIVYQKYCASSDLTSRHIFAVETV